MLVSCLTYKFNIKVEPQATDFLNHIHVAALRITCKKKNNSRVDG